MNLSLKIKKISRFAKFDLWRAMLPLACCVSLTACFPLGGLMKSGDNSSRAKTNSATNEDSLENKTEKLEIEKRTKSLEPSRVETASVGGSDTGSGSPGDSGGNASSSTSQLESNEVSKSELEISQTLSELNAEQTEQGIVINLPENILFDFDKAEIKPSAEPTLQKIRDLLNFYKDASMPINGHTDNKGSDDYNLKLSERRADSVKDYLTEHFNVAAARLNPKGFGENQPIAPNEKPNGADDPEGRQKNRRVEVILENAKTPTGKK